VAQKILKAYETYDYSTIFQAINAFITVDLSAFYADVSKDRLYTFAARSKERRSAQTAMFVMTDGLARLLAPILSFSADELWRYLPGAREESVHLASFPPGDQFEMWLDPKLLERWARLLHIRSDVNVGIEAERKEKRIGSSLGARVELSATADDYALLKQYEAQLPMLFIVSEVSLDSGAFMVRVSPARGTRCERCWRYVPKVSGEPGHPGICERCEDALAEAVSS
jgi:isoleucyl-tRNA synthetase